MPTLPKPLTAFSVSKLRPRPRRYDVRDGAIRGLMVRVYPSGTRTWYVEYPRDRRWIIGSVSDFTLQQARERASQIKAEVKTDGQPATAAGIDTPKTLRTFLDGPYRQWITVNQSKGQQMINRLISALPSSLLDMPLRKMTRIDVENWQSERRRAGKAPSTINREIAQLRSALKHAVNDPACALSANPIARIKPQPTDFVVKNRFLQSDEKTRLFRALRGRTCHLRPMTFLALNTGLRRGEIFDLQWSDIVFPPDGQSLTVRGNASRSKQPRTIKLNQRATLEMLRWQRLSSNRTPPERVFPGRNGGRLDNIKKGWAGLMREAQIENFRFDDCRHDFASRLVRAGVPLQVVSSLLGHGSIQLAQRYVHLTPDWGPDAVDVL
ncbi:MAG: tyrosine-type recombinase/integrase [Lysobacterales bacterium]